MCVCTYMYILYDKKGQEKGLHSPERGQWDTSKEDSLKVKLWGLLHKVKVFMHQQTTPWK